MTSPSRMAFLKEAVYGNGLVGGRIKPEELKGVLDRSVVADRSRIGHQYNPRAPKQEKKKAPDTPEVQAAKEALAAAKAKQLASRWATYTPQVRSLIENRAKAAQTRKLRANQVEDALRRYEDDNQVVLTGLDKALFRTVEKYKLKSQAAKQYRDARKRMVRT